MSTDNLLFNEYTSESDNSFVLDKITLNNETMSSKNAREDESDDSEEIGHKRKRLRDNFRNENLGESGLENEYKAPAAIFSLLKEQEKKFSERCEQLDATLLSRQDHQLLEEDRGKIQAVFDALFSEWDHRDWPSYAHATYLKGMMTRVVLYDGSHLQIRAHLFEDATETYIHNHAANFFTRCAAGYYHHRLYDIKEGQQIYYQVLRQPGGEYSVPQPQAGVIDVIKKHVFARGDLMFVPSTAFHTVHAGAGLKGEDDAQVITITFRSKSRKNDTLVWSDTEKIEQGTVEVVVPCTDQQREEALARLFACTPAGRMESMREK